MRFNGALTQLQSQPNHKTIKMKKCSKIVENIF